MEKKRIQIEFADNGIIIRDPQSVYGTTLALTKNETDLSNAYKAIGKKVYDWLFDVVIAEQPIGLDVEGCDVEICAKCFGR